MFWRKEEQRKNVIPVLCKFWKEDDVWNASAEHLPVAVFGDSFEEAQRHLCEAITSHLQSLLEAGRFDQTVALLKLRAHDRMLIDEIAPDSPLVKMLVPLKDHEVAAQCV